MCLSDDQAFSLEFIHVTTTFEYVKDVFKPVKLMSLPNFKRGTVGYAATVVYRQSEVQVTNYQEFPYLTLYIKKP